MKKGFTLTELIILLVVMALAVMFFFPLTYNNKGKEARQITCTSNQKQMGTAVMMFTQESNEYMPSVDENFFATIGMTGKILSCPNTNGQGYVANARLSNLKIGEVVNPVTVWLSADAAKGATTCIGWGSSDMEPRHAGGIIASYLDTHVAYSKNIDDVTEDILYNMKNGEAINANYDASNCGFTVVDNKKTVLKYIPQGGYNKISAAISKKSESIPNDDENKKRISYTQERTDKLRPGMSYAINVNGLSVSNLAKDDKVKMTVQLYLGYSIKGGNKIFDAKPVGKSFVKIFDKPFNLISIKTIPLYAAPPFEELKAIVRKEDQDYGNPALYPVITFVAQKSGTTVKIDNIDIVTMGH